MLPKILPAIDWLRHYRPPDLKGDLSAGTIVAIMLVPQGMAYAMLAGLPLIMGLYASTLPVITYALFGSSRQLSVGPVAMVSLLVFTGLSTLAQPGSERYVTLVLVLTLLIGFLQLVMGILRLGFFVHFFSHGVISGFTSAAALIILFAQLGPFLGIKLSPHHSIFPLLRELYNRLGEIHPQTVFIGILSIGVQLFLKRKFRLHSVPLWVVVGGAIAVSVLGLDEGGVKIVGQVPAGLPHLFFPSFHLDDVLLLFPYALPILFVGFMESISVAKKLSIRERYKVDSNQELRALGLANIVASLFSGYPVTGGFSRTAVNYDTGARTGLASLVTGMVILLVLIFLTPLFYYLPLTILASIVIVAVLGLINFQDAFHLFRLKRVDGWTWVLTFSLALMLGGGKGILGGMVFSLAVFIWRSAHPHAAELGYLEKENVFRNIKRYPEAKTFPETLMVRVDASLYFANMGFVEDWLQQKLLEKPETRWVLLDLSGVNDMDAVAIDTFEDMMDRYKERGIGFLFANVKGPVRDLLLRAGWDKKYGHHFYPPSVWGHDT